MILFGNQVFVNRLYLTKNNIFKILSEIVMVKSLYSILSIFLNSFFYLFYSKISEEYRNIFSKGK